MTSLGLAPEPVFVTQETLTLLSGVSVLQRAQDEVTLLASLEKTRRASTVYLGKSGTSDWQLFDGHEMN